MTREETVKWIKEHRSTDMECKHDEAMRMAIQSLEQESVIDKIRSEIEAYQSDAFYPDNVMMNKRMVLEIIDKYRKVIE